MLLLDIEGIRDNMYREGTIEAGTLWELIVLKGNEYI